MERVACRWLFGVLVLAMVIGVSVSVHADPWPARDAYLRGYPYKIGVYFETFTDTEWLDGYDTNGNKIVIFRGKISERIRNNFHRESVRYFQSLRKGTPEYNEYMGILQIGLKHNHPNDGGKIYRTVMNDGNMSFSEKLQKLVPMAYAHMFVVGTPIEIRLAPDGHDFGRRYWKIIEFYGVEGVDGKAIADIIYSS